ncbi:sarcosine oxidase subunit delta [Allostella sp. ATCC 35155]|nr:sarcosine oxidase subunit delta [Stella sp. ATCC 35155]
MLLIPCPWCGLRDEAEFHCGGESHVVRPPDPDAADDAAWAAYLFDRDNAKGVGFERWLHRHGCGRWFNVARDTVTHEIRAVYGMTDPRPETAS